MSTFEKDYMMILSDSVNCTKIFNAQMELFDFYLEDHNTVEAKKVLTYCDSVSKVAKFNDSLLTERRKDWKAVFNGWIVKHKYRAKNKQGNFELYEKCFYVYTDFSGVKEI